MKKDDFEPKPVKRYKPPLKLEPIKYDFSDDKEDGEVKGKPKKKGISYQKTKEPNISARYKDGIFQAYDVSIEFGRTPRYDDKSGEYVFHKETKKKSFKSFDAAKFWRDEQKVKRAKMRKKGSDMDVHKYTIDEVIRDYEEYLEEQGKSVDYISDKKRYGNHVKKYFTKKNNNLHLISRIEGGDIEKYLISLKGKYKYKTIEKEKCYLVSLWGFMTKFPKKYGIELNVAKSADLPDKSEEYKARILDYNEIEELIEEACKLQDPSFLYLVVFSTTQGLRRGELCGLKWSDVSFENRIVTIQHNRVQSIVDGHNLEKLPKKGRIRVIELHNAGYETLCLYKEWQESILGREVNPDDYVLQYEINLRYGYNPHTGKISRKWKETYNQINKNRLKNGKKEIPYGRLHDGRHIYASLLLNGVDVDDEHKLEAADYMQVYASMGHSLPKGMSNSTTNVYYADMGTRFTITNFWNQLIKISVKDEWQKCLKQRADEWNKMTELQRDLADERKKKRFEKAIRERRNNLPPETEVTYTEDGETPGFEEYLL